MFVRLLRGARLALLCACLTVILGAADISGKWNLVWDTEGGIRHGEWIIAQEGENLTVKSEGQVLSGTLQGDKLKVSGEFNSNEAGYSATLEVEGTLKDGKLSGRGTWDQYGMTFTATRSE